MLNGTTPRAWAMAGTAVLRIVVSSDSMKNAIATSHGSRRFEFGCSEGLILRQDRAGNSFFSTSFFQHLEAGQKVSQCWRNILFAPDQHRLHWWQSGWQLAEGQAGTFGFRQRRRGRRQAETAGDQPEQGLNVIGILRGVR